ncbi:DUF4357 domain-containing protein [Kingella potus]|nr:DUF4357 domain-containing protein [Kingella potus]
MLKLREQWLSDGLLAEHNPKQYRLQQDYTFSSPNYAAVMVIGKNADGWLEWKTAEGKTLHDCFRSGHTESGQDA